MKKNYFLIAILFAVTVLIVYSCNGGGYGSTYTPPPPPPPAGSATDSINMSGMRYLPAIDTVHVGAVVKWKNDDPYNHTVTSDDGTTFSSGNIAPGGIFTFTPAAPGTFPYSDGDYSTTKGKLVVKP